MNEQFTSEKESFFNLIRSAIPSAKTNQVSSSETSTDRYVRLLREFEQKLDEHKDFYIIENGFEVDGQEIFTKEQLDNYSYQFVCEYIDNLFKAELIKDFFEESLIWKSKKRSIDGNEIRVFLVNSILEVKESESLSFVRARSPFSISPFVHGGMYLNQLVLGIVDELVERYKNVVRDSITMPFIIDESGLKLKLLEYGKEKLSEDFPQYFFGKVREMAKSKLKDISQIENQNIQENKETVVQFPILNSLTTSDINLTNVFVDSRDFLPEIIFDVCTGNISNDDRKLFRHFMREIDIFLIKDPYSFQGYRTNIYETISSFNSDLDREKTFGRTVGDKANYSTRILNCLKNNTPESRKLILKFIIYSICFFNNKGDMESREEILKVIDPANKDSELEALFY